MQADLGKDVKQPIHFLKASTLQITQTKRLNLSASKPKFFLQHQISNTVVRFLFLNGMVGGCFHVIFFFQRLHILYGLRTENAWPH